MPGSRSKTPGSPGIRATTGSKHAPDMDQVNASTDKHGRTRNNGKRHLGVDSDKSEDTKGRAIAFSSGICGGCTAAQFLPSRAARPSTATTTSPRQRNPCSIRTRQGLAAGSRKRAGSRLGRTGGRILAVQDMLSFSGVASPAVPGAKRRRAGGSARGPTDGAGKHSPHPDQYTDEHKEYSDP